MNEFRFQLERNFEQLEKSIRNVTSNIIIDRSFSFTFTFVLTLYISPLKIRYFPANFSSVLYILCKIYIGKENFIENQTKPLKVKIQKI